MCWIPGHGCPAAGSHTAPGGQNPTGGSLPPSLLPPVPPPWRPRAWASASHRTQSWASWARPTRIREGGLSGHPQTRGFTPSAKSVGSFKVGKVKSAEIFPSAKGLPGEASEAEEGGLGLEPGSCSPSSSGVAKTVPSGEGELSVAFPRKASQCGGKGEAGGAPRAPSPSFGWNAGSCDAIPLCVCVGGEECMAAWQSLWPYFRISLCFSIS